MSFNQARVLVAGTARDLECPTESRPHKTVTSFACEMVVATMVAISLTKFLDQKKDGMKETVRHEAVIVFASEIQDNKANAIPDVLIKIVYSLKSDETCRFTWNSCEIWKLSLQ